MRRREFITLLGGAAAWPLAAHAQQGERVRRIGVLAGLSMDDPEGKARYAAFQQALGELGWTVGRNVQIDYRWVASSADRLQIAAELVALAPAVASHRMAPIRSSSTSARPATSIASSRGRSRPICRCRRRPSTN